MPKEREAGPAIAFGLKQAWQRGATAASATLSAGSNLASWQTFELHYVVREDLRDDSTLGRASFGRVVLPHDSTSREYYRPTRVRFALPWPPACTDTKSG